MAIPILLVVVVGLVCAIMLSIASKVFFVPVDETADYEIGRASCRERV